MSETMTYVRLAGSIILNAVYGYHVQDHEDPLVHAAEELMKTSETLLQGGWLVDFLTFRECFHCDSEIRSVSVLAAVKWVPGTKWRKLADDWRTSMIGWVNLPYEVFRRMPVTHLTIVAGGED